MKCCAPVLNQEMIQHRANDDPAPRCLREGKLLLRGAFGYRWFCKQHAAIWQEHNRIVARMRAL